MKRINPTALFLVITFGITYIYSGIFYLMGGKLGNPAGFAFSVAYMFIPVISVLIVEKLIYREEIRKRLLISFRINPWFVAAWLFGPLIALLTICFSVIMPGLSYSPDMQGMFERFSSTLTPSQIEQMRSSIQSMPVNPFILTLAEGLIAGITVNAVAAFGEELGWRGFLVDRFRSFHFARASLMIGFIWGLWHAPIILMGHNYPQHPVAGVLMMIVWCMLLSPMFVYITIKSRSVIAAAIMHGTMNATGGLAIMVIRGGNDLTTGITGLPGFAALVIFTAVFFIYDRYIARENIMMNKISINPQNLGE
jgi:membrane protease YdiL (CAAX protease family)